MTACLYSIWVVLNMINPTFSNTVTHYHQKKTFNEQTKRTETEWVRNVYKECYFGSNDVENIQGNTLSQASSYIARIPFDGTKKAFISGDIIVLGEVIDEIGDIQGQRATDLIAKYKPDCFTVRTISDNTKITYGAHYKLTGA